MYKVDGYPIEVFHSEIENRVSEAALTVGGLYTVMLRFKNPVPWGIRYAARVEEMSGENFENQRLRYIGLDPDLRPFDPIIAANIEDGVLNFRGMKAPCFSLLDNLDQESREPLSGGYFLDYSEPFGVDQKLREAVDISSSLVAGV